MRDYIYHICLHVLHKIISKLNYNTLKPICQHEYSHIFKAPPFSISSSAHHQTLISATFPFLSLSLFLIIHTHIYIYNLGYIGRRRAAINVEDKYRVEGFQVWTAGSTATATHLLVSKKKMIRRRRTAPNRHLLLPLITT